MRIMIYVFEFRDIRALRGLCGQPVSREFLLILSCHLSLSVQRLCSKCNSFDNFEVTRVGDPSYSKFMSSDPQGGACNKIYSDASLLTFNRMLMPYLAQVCSSC